MNIIFSSLAGQILQSNRPQFARSCPRRWGEGPNGGGGDVFPSAVQQEEDLAELKGADGW